MTPADEFRAAADALRAEPNHLPLTEPLADWFIYEAELIRRVPASEMRGRTEHALDVARAINGSQP
jgi:hypothetical protein